MDRLNIVIFILSTSALLGQSQVAEKSYALRHTFASQVIDSKANIGHWDYSFSEKVGVRDEIANREIDYSAQWIGKLVVPNLRSRFYQNAKAVEGVNGTEDEGVYAAYKINDYYVEILDSRKLSLLVENRNASLIDVNDVKSAVHDLLRIDDAALPGEDDLYSVEIQEFNAEKNQSYGFIHYASVNRSNWFLEPIEFYQSGSAVLFLVDKSMEPPIFGKTKYESGALYFGSINYDDPRPYLRFENTNRMLLANEYMKNYFDARGLDQCDPSMALPKEAKVALEQTRTSEQVVETTEAVAQTEEVPAPEPAHDSDNTALYLLLGILAIGGIAYFSLRRGI